MKKIGIYFDKGGGTRGGPYVRAKLLEKYLPDVKIYNDISHAEEFDCQDFQWRVPGKLNRLRHICTFHGILPLKFCSNLHAQASMWYRIREQKRILQTAEKVIAVSEEAKRQAQTLTNKPIEVIHAGIEVEKYKERKKEDTIMFLNSLEKYENLQVILKALKYGGWYGYECDSLVTSPPFVLDVYGYGRMQKQFKKMIDDDLLPVNIKAEAENEIIISELSRAKLLIQPALQETFGLPICEAMASGTIVIASDIPSHRENFENILFFKPNDHEHLARLIHEVMEEGKYKDLIPLAKKEVAEKYPVKKFIEKTREVYESLA